MELASFDLKGVNGFTVDIHHGVLNRRIVCLEIKVNPAKGLLLVVAEERVLDQGVHMLAGKA